jgi:hypothetical protein
LHRILGELMPVTDHDGKPFVQAETGESLELSGLAKASGASEPPSDCGKNENQWGAASVVRIMTPPS